MRFFLDKANIVLWSVILSWQAWEIIENVDRSQSAYMIGGVAFGFLIIDTIDLAQNDDR